MAEKNVQFAIELLAAEESCQGIAPLTERDKV